MKENLVLLEDLLEPWRVKSTNILLWFQKIVYIDNLDDIVDSCHWKDLWVLGISLVLHTIY